MPFETTAPSPLRILVIHTTYKHKGGEDSVVKNEIELLRSVGNTVELLQFSNSENTLNKVLQLIFNYGSYTRTIKAVREFLPDIVHIHNLHFGGSPSVMYALKKCKIPFVLTLHNYRLLCPSATLFFDGADFNDSINKSFSWKAVSKGVYQNSKLLSLWMAFAMFLHQKIGTYKLASRFIALGDYTKLIFSNSKLRSLADKIIIKPNFCYSESDFNNTEGDYYLYIGRLSEEKGVSTLLEAFSKNKLQLKIAGTGPMEQCVLDASKRYHNIEYLNIVSKEKVDTLLNHAIALIFPSKWLETFGMVIIEAFAKSIPVIASDLGQLKVTIKDKVNGLHFKAGSVEDLNDKIEYYQNLNIAQKIDYRKNAFASYQQLYTPQINASQLVSIYQDVLSKQS